ncbi:MAG: selenocysteine-specific translation elongation factor [Gammaproteobacteria bacterium]|nr:selenocysteine-specific translation elongation factor [Gammaproteobacteria bacterium]NIR99016.1 selenocysteine-specific translation elongation factor [Gammaproteobacteria bacterium]NIT64642.1 selenocysteine-specific translation elongation factor [Gammaproteobacteria bacterium]NIV21615.1 selenocysteine-specific translation elongation factor [Gammaproteobacteria bacterium]NIY33222.1 selenocysteine-specific translation elongation factor [Gammaproteobacteria bacterium]
MIVGTAGHIDHGKTALVRRLTGTDTDRLAEEKRRGLTIELGFAELELDNGLSAGVVDVPGHERFVRTMVAGATGMDLVLLVVAADDGVMPQTREHLEIAELLGARAAVVALNKVDRVNAERVAAVRTQIQALLEAGSLAGAPIVAVSARTGEGLEALRQTLAETLAGLPERGPTGYFRLAVDRVFVMPGFGPVATGTVTGGTACTGDTLRLLPGGRTARVRGLQRHGRAVVEAQAGQRCAVNLAGVDKDTLQRGMMLCYPRLTRAAHTIDAAVTVARDLNRPLKNHLPVRLHAGTAEVRARLVWLEPVPQPGESGLAQLRLEADVPIMFGDRFILRDGARLRTLGGGRALDPFARRRGTHCPERIQRLARLHTADADTALDVWLEARGVEGWRLSELAEQLAEPPQALEVRLRARRNLWRQTLSGEPSVALEAAVEALIGRLAEAVADYLAAHPRGSAMAEAALHAAACPRLERPVFRALVDRLVAQGALEKTADGLRPPGHRQRFSPAEQRLAERVEAELRFRGRPPPKPQALARALGRPAPQIKRFLGELERAGRLVQITGDVFVTTVDLDAWREAALDHLQREGQLTLAEFRDRIGAGRELALQVLEHFDRTGLTRRQGNARLAGPSVPEETAHG